MTRIESVASCLVRVPLAAPTSFSTRTVSEREFVLVKIRGDDDVEGIGFCYAGTRGGALALEAVRQLCAPLLLGEEAHATSRLWQKMYQECLLHGRTGVVTRAISALDIALWDRNARAARLPLFRYLG